MKLLFAFGSDSIPNQQTVNLIDIVINLLKTTTAIYNNLAHDDISQRKLILGLLSYGLAFGKDSRLPWKYSMMRLLRFPQSQLIIGLTYTNFRASNNRTKKSINSVSLRTFFFFRPRVKTIFFWITSLRTSLASFDLSCSNWCRAHRDSCCQGWQQEDQIGQ